MKAGIFYNKRTGEPVQIIARAQTKPTFQEVICYQELTKPYEHFVMEQRQFFSEYVKEFNELPLVNQRQIDRHEDLPDKQPLISKGVIGKTGNEESQVTQEPRIRKMIAFFDASTYQEKIGILESMKDDLDEHILNNMAVSLDLSIEPGIDGYQLIMSELKIRSKYEGRQGD